MTAFLKLTHTGLLGFVRDRSAIFFSLFFPLFFMLLFGTVFGGGDDKGPSIKLPVGVVMQDAGPAVDWVPDVFRRVGLFEVHSGPIGPELYALRQGKRNAVVVFPADFAQRMIDRSTTDVQIYYDPAQPQTAQMTLGMVRQILSGMDQRMSGRDPMLVAKEQPIERTAGGHKMRTVDFLVPGILAMTVMQLGIFTAIPIVNMREKGILKRLRATPLPRSTLVFSQVAMRLIIALGQTAILLAIAMGVFHFRIAGSWLALLGLTLLGALTFISIGAVLSGVAKTQEGAMPLLQLVNLPMLFLSGIFFPTDVMPSFLKPVTNAIPATYLADAMRSVTLASPSGHTMSTNLAVLAAWLAGGLLVAAKTFRWD